MSEDATAHLDTGNEERVEKWHALALMLGYNELANDSKTLGERVYARLLRDHFKEVCVKMGVELKEDDDKIVLVLGEAAPFIIFRERDIERTREAVAEHGARKSKQSEEA